MLSFEVTDVFEKIDTRKTRDRGDRFRVGDRIADEPVT